MFRLMLLAIFFTPAVYTYFRLKKFFTQRAHKVLFTVFYILLVLVFPAAEFMSHGSDAGWVKYLVLPGYYTMPFLLYLFLLVLLFDLLRGVNHLLLMVWKSLQKKQAFALTPTVSLIPRLSLQWVGAASPPAEVLRGRKFRLTAFWVIFILSAAIVVIGAVHLQTLRVKEYTIAVPRKSSVIKHLKIAVAADFHLGQMTYKGFLEKFTAKINSLRPDILLIPGDIIEGHRDDGDTEEFARWFRQIKTKYGVYASPGNHEAHGRGNKSDFFIKAGIEILADQWVVIDNSFCLVGRNDRHSDHRKPIAELLEPLPGHLPVIVLDHRPVDLEQVSRSGMDLQVSGHTHNGQLFPLNFIIGSIYEVGWGYKKIRGTHFFVTSGIQVWGPPVRTAGNSEIMLINVDFKEPGR